MCKTSLSQLPSSNMIIFLTPSVQSILANFQHESQSLLAYLLFICQWHMAPLVVGFCWSPRPSGCSRPRPAPYRYPPLGEALCAFVCELLLQVARFKTAYS